MIRNAIVPLVVFAAVSSHPAVLQAESAYPTEWAAQFGTSSFEGASGIAADASGNAYVTGDTQYLLGGNWFGSADVYIAKYGSDGGQDWIKQFGSTTWDQPHAIGLDGIGGVYVAGDTYGSLGGPVGGIQDAFVAKYLTDGTPVWVKQITTDDVEYGQGVAADPLGNVFVAGYTNGDLEGANAGTYDAYARMYNGAGDVQWTRQFGTDASDKAHGAAADGSGNVFVCGHTEGVLHNYNAGAEDAFVAKYDNQGNQTWVRQLGTYAPEECHGVAVDSDGNVFISGQTRADLGGDHEGSWDVFVARYLADGTFDWVRQFGTAGEDRNYGASVDGEGNVVLACATEVAGVGGGDPTWDPVVAKYDPDGTLLWTRQFGTPEIDVAEGIAASGSDVLYVCGPTDGDLGGVNEGFSDAFCVRMTAAVPGDLDLDGDVDIEDLSMLAANWDEAGGMTWQDGDLDFDGDVDIEDLSLLAANWGHPSAAAKVPEPTSLTIILALAVGGMARSRGGRAAA